VEIEAEGVDPMADCSRAVATLVCASPVEFQGVRGVCGLDDASEGDGGGDCLEEGFQGVCCFRVNPRRAYQGEPLI
jgi:hypothetical protein